MVVGQRMAVFRVRSFSVCIATANPDVVSVRQIRESAPNGVNTSRLTGDYLLRPSRRRQ